MSHRKRIIVRPSLRPVPDVPELGPSPEFLARKLEAQARQGQTFDTFGDLAQAYLLELEGDGLAAHRDYESVTRNHLFELDTLGPAEIDLSDVFALIGEPRFKRLSKSAQCRVLVVLSNIMDHGSAFVGEIVNPVPLLPKRYRPSIPKNHGGRRKTAETLSREELTRALHSRRARWDRRGLLLAGYGLGLRIGEIGSATLQDFDPERATITVHTTWNAKDREIGETKTEIIREVPAPAVLLTWLQELPGRFSSTFGRPMAPDDLLFPAAIHGAPARWTSTTGIRALAESLQAAGVEPIVRWAEGENWKTKRRRNHSMRTTFVRRLLGERVPFHVVQALVHSGLDANVGPGTMGDHYAAVELETALEAMARFPVCLETKAAIDLEARELEAARVQMELKGHVPAGTPVMFTWNSAERSGMFLGWNRTKTKGLVSFETSVKNHGVSFTREKYIRRELLRFGVKDGSESE